jgi:serine/threonine-protein kinase
VTELEQAAAVGELERVALLYRGPFLDAVHLPDAPEFEHWLTAESERLAVIARKSLEQLARDATARGDAEVAVGWWRRLAALDPLSGRVAVGLMEALAASGDPAGALRHAKLYEILLREELGVGPDAAVTRLAERLRNPEAPRPSSAPLSRPPVPAAPVSERSSALAAPTPFAPDERSATTDREMRAGQDTSPSITATEPNDSTAAVGARKHAGPLRSRRIRLWIAVTAALLAGVIVAPLLHPRRGTASPLERQVLVVVPFDIADPELRLWREGMVDVLSRNLDGAGPVHTLSPTRVVREWKGHADHEAAQAFARATGAQSALFGQLLRAGRDSVRATATLLATRTGEPIAEFRRQDANERMDRLTDSLTADILRALGATMALGAARDAPLRVGTSFEALRAFLQGEQFFRHAEWDSAVGHYARAVGIDSTFALAWRRLGLVASWQRLLQDSLTAAYLLRAGAANRGLGTRDSMLVTADSLSAAASTTSDAAARSGLTRRLFATLDTATHLYPGDPEVWFALGEARYHFGFGPLVGVSERATLDAFDRAIALDSAFAPAYIHSVELGFNLGGAPLGLRYARAYLARNPTEAAHRGVLLIEPLIDERLANSPAVARLLDTARTSAIVSARTILRRWPDSAETAVQLGRILARGRASEYPLFSDVAFMRRRLAEQLAFRGHFVEAARVLGVRDAPIFAELAYLGAVPQDDASAVFDRWLRSDAEVAHLALPWWSARRDTAALVAFLARVSRRLGTDTLAAGLRSQLSYDTASAGAHLALARGDTATALRRFLTMPDTLCTGCYLDRLTRARLLAATGSVRAARRALDEPLDAFLTPIEVLFALERARVANQLGDSLAARASYRLVHDAWVGGDSTVLQMVAEAARALTPPPPATPPTPR